MTSLCIIANSEKILIFIGAPAGTKFTPSVAAPAPLPDFMSSSGASPAVPTLQVAYLHILYCILLIIPPETKFRGGILESPCPSVC